MTYLEFIKSQTLIWGEDYVEDLIERNFSPTLTSAGWRWVYVADNDYSAHIERITALDNSR